MSLNSEALFSMTVGRIRRSLLPKQVISNGRVIRRPPAYDPPPLSGAGNITR